MEAVYEQFFFLKYHGGWSLSEAYNLPVGLRNWFVKRLIKQIELERKTLEDAHNGASGTSSPQTLTAHNQPAAPSKYK